MTRLQMEGSNVLSALDEGIFTGVIMCLEYQGVKRKDLVERLSEVLHNWNEEKLTYWIDWVGLKRS